MNPWEMNLNGEDTKSSPTDTGGKMPWELNLGGETKSKERPNSGLGDMSSMSLVGALKGTKQTKTPFTQPQTTEPSLNLNKQRYNEGQLSIDEQNKSIIQGYAAAPESLYTKYSTIGNEILGAFNPEAKAQANQDIAYKQSKVVEELRARGIPAEYRNNTLYAVDQNGNEVEVPDSSVLQSLYRSKFEAGGAVAGAIAGSTLGSKMGTGLLGKAAGGVIGGAVGAFTGAGADALLNNIDMVNKASDEEIFNKMKDAGIADIVMAPLGYVVGKTAVGLMGISGKLLNNVFSMVYDRNLTGAKEALLNHFGYDEAMANEAIQKFENLVGPLRGLNDKEKAIYVLTQTQKGGEGVVQAANVLDTKASANMANQVSQRAEDLLKSTNELSADNIGTIVKQNMDNYSKEVKGFYDAVKQAPEEFTKDFSFDFEKIGIQPILDEIGAKIENPAIKQRFVDTLGRIEDAAQGRSFTDLIDLRQAVNDIKFNTSKLKFSDNQALDNVLKSIDTEIEQAAKTHIPNYDTWLENWGKAKTEYAKMKDVESNVLYKALTRPGITEDMVVKAFSRYIGANDNTFYQVMEKLPKAVQNRVEGAVLNNLTEKFAAGTLGGNRAIHFPLLSRELSKVSWQSPQAKQIVRTVHRMAEVFTNDVNLARVSGNIEIPRFQSYLTTDPIVRMKYEIASKIFNKVKQYMPGDAANALSLVSHTGRLLENPLSSKSVKDLARALPKERRTFRTKLDFNPELNQIRQAYVERQQALKQVFNKDIPPRLVWKTNPEDLARLQNPEATILPSVDQVLYATTKGTIGKNPSEAIMNDRAHDLITEFIWRNTQGKSGEAITEQAMKYMEDNRFTNIMQNVAKKLSKDDFEANAKVVANSIKSEAGILIRRIEKDFGVKMPKDQAEKLVALKYKEIMEKCNG